MDANAKEVATARQIIAKAVALVIWAECGIPQFIIQG
jgi:hypothetical protein